MKKIILKLKEIVKKHGEALREDAQIPLGTTTKKTKMYYDESTLMKCPEKKRAYLLSHPEECCYTGKVTPLDMNLVKKWAGNNDE